MSSNVTSCSTWRLYVILDDDTAVGRDLVELAIAAIRGGADVLQLRAKRATDDQLAAVATRLLVVTRPHHIPLLINDRPQVAADINADGVHLGQDDAPVAEARRLLRGGKLVGKSTHSLEQALAAQAEGADYIGVGPIFPTPTKPNYGSVGLAGIRQVRQQLSIPFTCIGGIDAQTIGDVVHAGAYCVAVVRAVCAAADPESAARSLKQRLLRG